MPIVKRIAEVAATAIVGYFAAAFLYAAILGIAGLPSGPLWDPSFGGPLRFVSITVVIVALFIPLFRRDVDVAIRAVSTTTAAFLILYAFMKSFGLGEEADLPIRAVVALFEPIGQGLSGISH